MHATIDFIKNLTEGAAFVSTPAGEEVRPHEGQYHTVKVPVMDMREHVKSLSLNHNGYQLVKQNMCVSNFLDDDALKTVYEGELKSLLKKETGAHHVEVFDHTRRSTSTERRQNQQLRDPVCLAHNDYTATSGVRRLDDYLASETNEPTPTFNRFIIVNVWRTMNKPISSNTLAICDASSVNDNDLIAVTRKSQVREGEIQLARYHKKQRWGFFSVLHPNEALLFKTFDSDTNQPARFTPHASFNQNDVNGSDSPRESIESRCFLFFNEGNNQ